MTTYWHGGPRIAGDVILPPEEHGGGRSGDGGVHITTDRGLAESYASTVEGAAWVYEVEPIGEVVPVPPTLPIFPQVSYRCERARIIRRFTVSAERRRQAQANVARAGRMIGGMP